MNTIKLRQRGTLTLPKRIRDSFKLTEGDILRISERDEKIILERVESSDTSLLHDIKDSLAEIKKGKFIEFGSIPEFKRKLRIYDAN